jgi:small-conductance mechanosensitive channel
MDQMIVMGFKFSDLKWEGWLFDIGILALKIFLFYLIYKVVRAFTFKVIETIFSRMQAKEHLSDNRTKTLESLTKNAVGYVFIFILIVTILEMFHIDVTAILAGAGIVGLAVGFGAQGLVSDVVTGFFILLEKQIDVGDEVTIGVINGVVEVVGLKTIQIRDFDGSLHFIPNRQIGILSNHSRGAMRAMVEIKLKAEDDLEEITKVIKEICHSLAEKDDDILMGPEILGIQDIGTADYTIRIVARTTNGQQYHVERLLRSKIKVAIDQIRLQYATEENG